MSTGSTRVLWTTFLFSNICSLQLFSDANSGQCPHAIPRTLSEVCRFTCDESSGRSSRVGRVHSGRKISQMTGRDVFYSLEQSLAVNPQQILLLCSHMGSLLQTFDLGQLAGKDPENVRSNIYILKWKPSGKVHDNVWSSVHRLNAVSVNEGF